jgi:hypothetical protein
MDIGESALQFHTTKRRAFRNIFLICIFPLRIKNAKVFTSTVILASLFSISAVSQATAYGITWTSRTSASDNDWYGITYGNGLFVAVSDTDGINNQVMTSGVIGLAARISAAANTEAARVAAANTEAARKAKEQKELMEILALIPSIGQLTLSLGETTKSLYSTKCVKGKTTKYVKYGAKCPKGYVKKK